MMLCLNKRYLSLYFTHVAAGPPLPRCPFVRKQLHQALFRVLATTTITSFALSCRREPLSVAY